MGLQGLASCSWRSENGAAALREGHSFSFGSNEKWVLSDLSRKIDGLPEPALLTDRAGTVIAANLAASRLLRVSPMKVVGQLLHT